MELKNLIKKLSEIDLILMDRGDGLYSVGRKDIANPLFFFTVDDEYMGTLEVKSINTRLFTPEQIYKSLCYVDSYLLSASSVIQRINNYK